MGRHRVLSPDSSPAGSAGADVAVAERGVGVGVMALLKYDFATADCVVVVADREVPCHKCVLALASDVFRTMLFKVEMREQRDGRIELKGVSEAGWEVLHNYIYERAVPSSLDAALEAVKVADMYAVAPLLTSARDTVVRLTSRADAARVWGYAVEHLAFPAGRAIAWRAYTLVRDHFDAVVAAPNQLDALSDACFELLIRSSDLRVVSEDLVLEAVLRRVNAPAPDTQYMARMAWFAHVRWGRLSRRELAQCLGDMRSGDRLAGNEPWVAAFTAGMLDALCYHIDNGEARLLPSNMPRGGSSDHLLVVCASRGSGAQVSAPLVVGAVSWQLRVAGWMEEDEELAHLPVTLEWAPTDALAAAAGVEPPSAVCVAARLFTFDLAHDRSRTVPYDTVGTHGYGRSCDYARACGLVGKSCSCTTLVADERVTVRRARKQTAGDGAAPSSVGVAFPTALLRPPASGSSGSDGSTTVNRLGVGVSFSVAIGK